MSTLRGHGLREHGREYLVLRRALGFKLAENERLLFQFIDYCEQIGARTVIADVAVTWASQSARGSKPAYRGRRLSVVRAFARHLATVDPDCQVPSPLLLRCFRQRQPPHLYSPEQIQALMDTASRLFPTPLRAATYRTLIGLLAATGLRVGEAVRLDREHVDLDTGVLSVIDSKYGKSRQLLLHPTTIAVLREYQWLRDRVAGSIGAPAFFVSTKGRLVVNTVDYVFADIVAAAGIRTSDSGRPPRVHDLRHSFAVATLLHWYRIGADVQARLPTLSTWLGHLSPKSTYWYLQASPELLDLAAQRLENPIPSSSAGALSWPRSHRSSKRSSPTTW